jgi:DNA-directed RNA polymerase subunit D
MKLQVRELTDTRCSFVVDDTTPDVVNTLRRALISEVPKMAIDEVEFHMGPIRDEEGNEYDSNSALFDEMIAHRLGLVPIPTDLKSFTFKDKCECGGNGCPHCTIIYVLNKKGPCMVYSGDLQPLGDMSLRVKEELIPIVKLKEKQALLIYATAVMGLGSTHAKWQPVTVCGYKYYPQIKAGACKDPQSVASSCPKHVLGVDGKKVVVEELERCDLCQNCVSACQKEDGTSSMEVTGREDKFIFSFETDGSIKAKDALTYALEMLQNRFDDLREQFSGIETA